MPLTTLHFTGWTPPTVASFVRYVFATFAGFKRRVFIVSRGATVNAAADVVTRPSLSVAVMPNAKIPAFWGVPAIVPRVASSTTPGGNAPDTSAHVYVPLPPVAVKVFARRIPTSLLGGRAGPNGDFTLRGWRTVSAYVSVSDGLPCTALTTNWKLPSEVGVPLRTPDVESVTPAGSAPDSRDQVACTSWPVTGFRLTTCFVVSVSVIGLADRGRLDRLVDDRKSGVDRDAEFALRFILELAPGWSALRRGQVAIPQPEARDAGARGDAGDDAVPRQRKPCRKRAVDEFEVVVGHAARALLGLDVDLIRNADVPRRTAAQKRLTRRFVTRALIVLEVRGGCSTRGDGREDTNDDESELQPHRFEYSETSANIL